MLVLGATRLTTTRVAERAGVSVGTLYQYFPHKQSLLAALLERHLMEVVVAVEGACAASKGMDCEAMVRAVVGAFIGAKFRNTAASRALYAVAGEVGGDALVARLMQRVQLALCETLATATDRRFDELGLVSLLVVTAMAGPVQALLAADAPVFQVLAAEQHLVLMLAAYLLGAGRAAD